MGPPSWLSAAVDRAPPGQLASNALAARAAWTAASHVCYHGAILRRKSRGDAVVRRLCWMMLGLVACCLLVACRQQEERAAGTAPTTAAPSQASSTAPGQPPETEFPAGQRPLRVHHVTTCRGVVDRNPSGEDWRFSTKDEMVWLHTALNGMIVGTKAELRFVHDGEVQHSQRVHVGQNPRWRTWAFMRTEGKPTGRWEAEVVTEDGTVAARRPFWIVEE